LKCFGYFIFIYILLKYKEYKSPYFINLHCFIIGSVAIEWTYAFGQTNIIPMRPAMISSFYHIASNSGEKTSKNFWNYCAEALCTDQYFAILRFITETRQGHYKGYLVNWIPGYHTAHFGLWKQELLSLRHHRFLSIAGFFRNLPRAFLIAN